ncbi:MAG: HupE/UreJ family protein [Verrucomicrobiaceae bacterium]|nr:HupE/UreJ family protein [Verrucomicrobiaceae bacterium]
MKSSFASDSHLVRALLLVMLGLPSLAHAHIGVGHASGLLHGMAHPVSGLDHLCAMVAVGLWAAQCGGRTLWLVPLAFVSVMTVGGMLGAAGMPLPLVEQGIAASLLVLGLLMAAAVRLPLAASVGLVGLFALFHGHAHGTEMPDTASGLAYGLGFVIVTISLHLLGMGAGVLVQKWGSARLLRFAGGAVTVCGVYLCLQFLT